MQIKILKLNCFSCLSHVCGSYPCSADAPYLAIHFPVQAGVIQKVCFDQADTSPRMRGLSKKSALIRQTRPRVCGGYPTSLMILTRQNKNTSLQNEVFLFFSNISVCYSSILSKQLIAVLFEVLCLLQDITINLLIYLRRRRRIPMLCQDHYDVGLHKSFYLSTICPVRIFLFIS